MGDEGLYIVGVAIPLRFNSALSVSLSNPAAPFPAQQGIICATPASPRARVACKDFSPILWRFIHVRVPVHHAPPIRKSGSTSATPNQNIAHRATQNVTVPWYSQWERQREDGRERRIRGINTRLHPPASGEPLPSQSHSLLPVLPAPYHAMASTR